MGKGRTEHKVQVQVRRQKCQTWTKPDCGQSTVYYTYIDSYTVYPTVSVYLTFGEYTYTKRLEPYLVQCLVRHFMSSPVNLNTDTSPSLSVLSVQPGIATTIGILLSLGLLFLVFRVRFWMPLPLGIFKFYMISFQNTSDIIKADPTRMPSIKKASMPADWNPHIFVGCISCSGSTLFRPLSYLVPTTFPPSRYSHRILDRAGDSSQTSKI